VLCILGTDEYLYKEDIMATKFFIGVPWHGYDYKCSDYEVNVQNNITQIFELPTVDYINYNLIQIRS
jgi:hypothetical protein